MESTIRDILLVKKYDGMVLGGNDFLYTKDMDCHPMAFFLYEYGRTLVECGLDTIYLENHYITEELQTRGLIGSVMYCAYLYKLRVIGIEGKFTPEMYKKYTGIDIEDTYTTVAFSTRKRLERLNLIVKHIVEKTKKGKYLLFCGMSHVNDETDVTQCGGIKTLLGVPGIGCVFTNTTSFTKDKPFRDLGSGYSRPADYLIELDEQTSSKERFYIDTYRWCMIHDYLFLYKTIYHLFTSHQKPISVKSLWNHTSTIYPPKYMLYMNHMIEKDNRLQLPEKELHDVGSYVHSLILSKKSLPSRKQIVSALEGLQVVDLYAMVDQWANWIRKKLGVNELDTTDLNALSDMVFLEYKKLSTERKEDRYIDYLRRKYSKQLERPEHKIYRVLCMMNEIGILSGLSFLKNTKIETIL